MRPPLTLDDAGGPLGTPARLRLGAETVRAYAATRARLRRGALPEAVAAARRSGTELPAGPEARRALGLRLARISARVLRPLPLDDRCLTRSVVLVALLARRGVRGTVVLGVAAADEFAAHAWVEVDGAPVSEPGGARYPELTRM